MFADPQSITINAVANSLPRTGSGVDNGNFTKDDANVKLSIKHSYNSRFRRVVRIDFRKVAADPLATGYNKEYSMSTYLVVDTPNVGFTVVEQKYVIDALTKWLTDGSGAAVTRLLGGES